MTVANGLPHIDLVPFRKLGVLMPAATLQQFVDTYLQDAETRIGRISGAVTAQNAPDAHHAAHSLRGSSSMLGFAKMAALSEKVETATADGSLAALDPLVAELRGELAQLRTLMTSVVTLLPR